MLSVRTIHLSIVLPYHTGIAGRVKHQMTHRAIRERPNCEAVVWLEKEA